MSTDHDKTFEPSSRVVFSAPELVDIRRTFTQMARSHRDDVVEVWFDGHLIDEHIEGALRYTDSEGDRVLRMVAAVPLEAESAKALLDARTGIVEFLGSMFERWLEESEHHSPSPDWKEYQYAGKTYVFRGSLLNEKLESDADAFLRQHGVDPEQLYEHDSGGVDADVPKDPDPKA